MSSLEFFFLFTIIFIVIGYIWYATIVSKRSKVLEALSGIDVQLKKRSNLMPNILKIAAKFMKHEKDLMEKITILRSKVSSDYDKNSIKNIESHLRDASELEKNITKFMILSENYPDLKSQETMIKAQSTYNEVEEQIAAARRFYNTSVASLNSAIQIFPGNILAAFAKAQIMPFYITEETSKSPIDIDQYI